MHGFERFRVLPGFRRLVLSSFLVLLCAAAARAQISHFETEPNNTPAEASTIRGATTVLGTLDGDDQDGFMWTVSADDARKRWVFELQGVPGRLSIAQVFRVEFADDGVDVAGKDSLMKMGTRDGYTPAITRELMFEPGAYLIGIAHAGGDSTQPSPDAPMFRPPTADLSFGDDGSPDVAAEIRSPAERAPGAYRFIIRESSPLNLQPQPPSLTREDARPLRPGEDFHTFETREAAWYTIDFKPEETNQRWDLRVQVPIGRTADATLFDTGGQQLDKRRSGERGLLEFADIVPGDQPYALQLEFPEPGFTTAVGSVQAGRRVDGEEAEPNGQWALANRFDLAQPLQGRMSDASDTDHFTFSVDESTADRLQSLRLESQPSGQQLLLCLHDAATTRLQCRNTPTPIELPDLALTPGEYGISVARAAAELQYAITLIGQGPIEPGMEIEPNDEIAFATTVPTNLRIHGRGSGRENDYFHFLLAEEPQLWRFQIIGDGILEVSLHDSTGHSISTRRPPAGERRVQLDNVFLLPGKHYVKVHAEDGARYTLMARPLGPPDPDGEREPNDDTSRMQRLAVGQVRTGSLTDSNDNDYYRFFLANWDHVRLQVQSPVDGIVAPHIHWYTSSLAQGIPSEPGQTMTFAGVLPPGDYYVQLHANQPSDAEYRLSLERLPRWGCRSDCEPNGLNTYYGASALPSNLVLEGVSGEWRDVDSYQLPVLSEPTGLVIRSPESVAQLMLGPHVQGGQDIQYLQYDADSGAYRTTLPADAAFRIMVASDGKPYRLEIEFENGPKAPAEPSLALELDLVLDTDTVSAYRQHGQRVHGQLAVSNAGAEALTAQLEAVTSDYRWQVSLGQPQIILDAGGDATVPVEVRVPPDAWADRPVRLSVRAVHPSGAHVETWADMDADRESLALEPTWNWAIPDALRGGFNAAWLPFGGELVGDVPAGADHPFLRDGYVIDGLRTQCCGETYGWKDTRPTITLELPGDEPAPVAGLTLNHFGVPWPYQNLRRGTLLLSTDGQSFDEALSFEALPIQTEQYFALDEPVMARFARLRLEETYEQRSGASGVTFGEWKVVLEPGHDLSGGKGFDIASPDYGGHLVWDWPPAAYSPVEILDEGKRSYDARIGPDAELQYVIAFQDNRAAQIQRIEWTNPDGVAAEHALARIVVSVSTESPIGPWTAVGELDPGHSAETETLELTRPVWARFVRFTGERQGESEVALRPNVIRIWERPTGPDYRSILAEWGQLSRRSWYEEQAGIPPEPARKPSDNTSRERAAPIIPGESAGGQVELAKVSHWYRLTMPADANTLRISLAGEPTVRAVLNLEDTAGMSVPVRKLPAESTPRAHAFEAFADPGSELYFHVQEPPRNVIFTWDTSASVNAHLPTIYNSLAAFVSQVVPGQESANFVPFSEPPLLDTWLGEPYMLQTILNDYPRRQSSSAGEHALADSTRTLAPVAGTKSIVIITDGAVNHHGPLWEEVRKVQPRVFSVGVAGEGGHNLDVFQDWSSANGGHFTHLRYQGEMEIAFDRAATLMRRPADYTLEVQTEFREAPGPGRIQVVSAPDGSAAEVSAGAIALILDASGSMLQRLDGKRRIVIAKEVLTQAVRDHVPAGTPVSLRAFGHTEPGSCETALLMPLAPLDPEAAAATIAGVQAKNLARTPIADSLAAVPSDLRGAQAATVVLVTDGEETCEGDPAAVIQSLRDQGIDVTVNIVGFAIDDAALEDRFAEWATLGGGRYFAARDQSALSDALQEALQVPYSVLDTAGTVVARGLVNGEPVELARGVYRVTVKSDPPQTFEEVDVRGEDEYIIELEDK